MKIINERSIPLAEVRNILREKKREYTKEEKEQLYEQKRALDHANKSTKLNLKDSKKLIKELSQLEFKLGENQIIRICDLLPETVDDMRAIFAKERFRYTEEEIKKILDIVDQYR
ncbi:MAG: RNA polymerase Rpb4 family protein [Candidatus Altiarchaeota archaeon]|nr:RNA polymerase Rpb4 family protein [Candidatus Altiarchaeota archaeon]